MVRLATLDLDEIRKLPPGADREEALALVNEMALRHLSWFIRLRFFHERRRLVWQPYLDVLCETMEAVAARELKRLIINMPPRSLKSETITQCWQAWLIARDDSARSSVVSASYAMSLAERDAIKTREIIRSQWFVDLAPTPIGFKRDTQCAWETMGGATRTAAGTDGPITGKGGDHLIVDDGLKPLDANSELVREKVNAWYGETLRSRLNDPDTGTITIPMQRLHERDLAGYLIEKQINPDADQWTHINLPLIAEKRTTITYGRGRSWTREIGDCLNPARWPEREVRALRAMMGPNFEGQYQQRPTKQQGGMLQPSKLLRVAAPAPAIAKRWGLTVSLYLDLATKAKQTVKDDPDWSVIAALARDQLDRVWILDIWRERVPMDETAKALLDMMTRWRVNTVSGEKIGLQHAFRSVLTLTCRLRRRSIPYLRDIDIQDKGDKVQKAGSFAGLLNIGLVGVPAEAPWLPVLETEMRTFPLGTHDDQVDAISLGCDDLQSIIQGEAPAQHDRLKAGQIDGNLLALARKRAEQLKDGPEGPEDTWD
jgi:predicted phage terminase large subunit-like protein